MHTYDVTYLCLAKSAMLNIFFFFFLILREAIPLQVSIWTRFRHCCVDNYKSVSARRFSNIVFQVVKSLGIG